MFADKENEAENVLVGAIDELTDSSFSILQRFGLYKREPVSNLDLYKDKSKGTIAGEGASFFYYPQNHPEMISQNWMDLPAFINPQELLR